VGYIVDYSVSVRVTQRWLFPSLLPYLAASALLGDTATLTSPCTPSVAGSLCKAAANVAEGHWVALEPTTAIMPTAFDPALLDAPSSIKTVLNVPDRVPQSDVAPLAVGRIDWMSEATPIIDSLHCSLPKEDPEHNAQLGLVIDELLIVWADHCAREATISFDDLAASASLFTREALASRGFVDASDATDLSALARGASPVTHAVDLALAATMARERASLLVSAPGPPSPLDIAHATTLADTLHGLKNKVDLRAPQRASAEVIMQKRDPWAGIKGFGMS